MKIPIVKNGSQSINDLIGYLDLTQAESDELARQIAAGVEVRLNAGVEMRDGKPVLKHVWFGNSYSQEQRDDALHGAKFVPDDNGGHIEFAGKCFRV